MAGAAYRLCRCNSMRPHLFFLFSIFPSFFLQARLRRWISMRALISFPPPPFFLQARLRRWKSMRADLGMAQVKLLVKAHTAIELDCMCPHATRSADLGMSQVKLLVLLCRT